MISNKKIIFAAAALATANAVSLQSMLQAKAETQAEVGFISWDRSNSRQGPKMAIACLFVVICALAGARAYNEVQDAVGGNI